MANPADSSVQNLLPVQAYFDYQGNFITFIGQNKPFTATISPDQSGLHITNSTIDSTTIGATTPSTGVFTNIATTTGTISATPTIDTNIANKAYVDSVAQGLSFKAPATCASTANIPTLSGLLTIDGVTLVAGNRVLVKNQATQADNGIYVASAGAWARSADANTWDEIVSAYLFIEDGDIWGGSSWVDTNQRGGTLGTTPITFVQFSNNAIYTAGTGLTLTGFEFSITNTGATAGTYGSASRNITQVVNAQGQITNIFDQPIDISATQIGSGTIDSARISGNYSGITGVGTLTNLTVTNTISGSINGNAATATSATTATNLAGGAAGSLPYQTGSGATTFLAASTNGYILSLVSGSPAWIPNTVGTVTDVTASAPLSSSGGSTPNITISQAGSASNGYLSSTDWNTFNNKANSGANSDITSMTGITGGISSPDYIQFDTGATVTRATGRLWWDSSDGIQTLNLGMAGSNATLQIGEEMYYRIKCSSAITEGEVVMFTGTVGASGGLTGAPATGLTAETASYIMGVATESGATNDWIYVTSFGLVRGINTSMYSNGDILWYNPSVAGGLTTTVPAAPNAKVQVAAVVYAAAVGSIFVRPAFGGSLGQYEGDVQVTTPANGDLLIRNQTSGKWVNAPLTAGTGISITNAAGSVTIANTATTSIAITDDTTSATTFYPTFTSATSGSITGESVSSTKLQYVPSTGALTATKYYGDGSALTGIVSGASISNDTSTASNLYPLFATVTTGVPTTIYTSNAKYLYKPSTGDLQASQVVATNGLVVNSATVSTSYTVASGQNAMSVGPMTVASGQTVTVSSGQRWVIL